jgi:ribonuclease BN (tRNA processing enzyme)
MKIKVLGCSGAEFPGRNLPSFLLDGRILFDAGSITDYLDEKNQLRVENIFITHSHLDHVKGIPFLLDNVTIRDRQHKVNVFSISPIIKTIKKNLLNSLVWPDFVHKGIIKLREIKAGQLVRIGDYTISAVRVNHSVPAVGYLVEDKKKRRFFYTGDTGPSGETWKSLEKNEIHCLIIEVTFPNQMEETALKTGHLTPRLLKKELLKMKPAPKKIYVTHAKPQYLRTISLELRRLKISNLRLLRDGESITL